MTNERGGKRLSRVSHSSPRRVFPISSARLFIQPGRPQPGRVGVEAGCEPSHQERSDPGEAQLRLCSVNAVSSAGLGPLDVTSPRRPDMSPTFMMIDDKARGRRGGQYSSRAR